MRLGYTDGSDETEALELGWKHMFLVLWGERVTLIKANLCFLLFSIPVVTAPAALTALHRVCIDTVRGRQVRVFRVYLDMLRTTFVQSLGAAAVLLLAFAAGAYGAVFYYRWFSGPLQILLLLPSAAAVTAVLMAPYCFGMLASVDLPWLKVMKNAFLLAFLNLRFGICGSVAAVALLVLQLLWWLRALPLVLTCSISVTVYIAAYFALFGIQKFVLTQKL